MSESNNNIPMRITQLEEATSYPEGSYIPIAKAGYGTFKINTNEPMPYVSDNILCNLPTTLNRDEFCDGNIGEEISITESSAWCYAVYEVEQEKEYDITFYQPDNLTAPCVYLCDENNIILSKFAGTNKGWFTTNVFVDDSNIKYIYVRSNLNRSDAVSAKRRVVAAVNKLEELTRDNNLNKTNIQKVVSMVDGTLESKKNVDGKIGEEITISTNNLWSYGVFDVSMDYKYNVTFKTTWTIAVFYVFLCDSTGLIKKGLKGNTAYASNNIQVLIDDPEITKMYIRTFSDTYAITCERIVSPNGIINKESDDIFKTQYDNNNTIAQLSSVVDSIGISNFKDKKLNTVFPYHYSAWPYLGVIGDKIRCIYTIQEQHVPEHSIPFEGLKIIESTNGVIWSEAKNLYPDNVVNGGGITGIGNDLDGNLLMWGRLDSAPYHSIYRMTNDSMELVYTLPNDMPRSHIGDIITGPNDVLYCFYNTYGNTREWGMLASSDNGETWTRKVIETGLSIPDCPVEISAAYIGNNNIIAIGRKDLDSGTIAMFQLQSSDAGETWSKQYTNITDAYGNTAALLVEGDSLLLYYFVRAEGVLRKRVNTIESVWNHPTAWNASETLAYGTMSSLDNGQVKAVKYKGNVICSFYSGYTYQTGIYTVID